MRIRHALAVDLLVLQDIERAAGESFRALGMPEIADDAPPPLDLLEEYRLAGRAWVTEDASGRTVAYLIHEVIDGAAHVEQLSVHPDAAHQGIGRALLDHLATHASRTGLPALTLTTFTEVPWNAPYYARLGFRVLPEDDITPGLRKIRDAEAAHGLERWPRVCMRREIQRPAAADRP